MQAVKQLPPFHLAFPVSDLDSTQEFYCEAIGCGVGRSSDTWIDFNMFGHQIVAHKVEDRDASADNCSAVDGKDVPIPHFGLVLEWRDWELLAARLRARNVNFIIEPYVRFEGQVGEQATMFLNDPSGNSLEFKAFKDVDQMFASQLKS